jgi:hypothetical protein
MESLFDELPIESVEIGYGSLATAKVDSEPIISRPYGIQPMKGKWTTALIFDLALMPMEASSSHPSHSQSYSSPETQSSSLLKTAALRLWIQI